jgi:hypothetical protein
MTLSTPNQASPTAIAIRAVRVGLEPCRGTRYRPLKVPAHAEERCEGEKPSAEIGRRVGVGSADTATTFGIELRRNADTALLNAAAQPILGAVRTRAAFGRAPGVALDEHTHAAPAVFRGGAMRPLVVGARGSAAPGRSIRRRFAAAPGCTIDIEVAGRLAHVVDAGAVLAVGAGAASVAPRRLSSNAGILLARGEGTAGISAVAGLPSARTRKTGAFRGATPSSAIFVRTANLVSTRVAALALDANLARATLPFACVGRDRIEVTQPRHVVVGQRGLHGVIERKHCRR